MERFKDCPVCKGRQSMIVSIKGWLCIKCFHLIQFSKGKEAEENAETTPPAKL